MSVFDIRQQLFIVHADWKCYGFRVETVHELLGPSF